MTHKHIQRVKECSSCCATQPIDVLAFGESYTGTSQNAISAASVKSLTLTKERGVNVQVSYDGGGSWQYWMYLNGSRTWNAGQKGNLDVSNMRFRGGDITARYDIIWEI